MALKPFAVEPLALGTITPGNEAAGYPASNLGEFKHIGMSWRTTNTTNMFLKGDFGAPRDIDFMALLLTNAQQTTTMQFALTNDATFATFGYNSGTLPMIDPVISRPDGLYSAHLELPSVQTYRYWYLAVPAHTPAFFEAATLVMGKKLSFANYYSPGFEFGTEDLGDIELGRWGVPDETPGLIFRRWTGKFGWMSQSDMDTSFRPLIERVGKRTPIFFCMDPDPTVNRQARTYFGWLKEPPFFTGAVNKFDRYEAEFSIISQI
jgi:hypothetical protein